MNVMKTIDELVKNGVSDNLKKQLEEGEENSRTLQEAYQENVEKLKVITSRNFDDVTYLWNSKVYEYVKRVYAVKEIFKGHKLGEFVTKNVYKEMADFINRCADKDFQIALVGAIKAGKSTLINAMLKMDLASTDITPETASLTKFRNSNDGNYVQVFFYNEKEWAELWESVNKSRADVFLEEYKGLKAEEEKATWIGHGEVTMHSKNIAEIRDEIKKWTSSKSAVHYFVKEVVVGIQDSPFEDGIVLVDTPGLNDVVEYRSNITRDYINRANAVLVCVDAKRMTAEELSTIYGVFANTRHCPEKVYVIATQLDTLNRPADDWKKQKGEWKKYLKGKGAYGKAELAEKNLVGVSAFLYSKLLSEDFVDTDSCDDTLYGILVKMGVRRMKRNDEEYQKKLAFCNVETLMDKLKSEILINFRELQIRDIEEHYDVCRVEIGTLMKGVKGQQVDIIKTVEKGVDEVRKQRRKYEEALESEREEQDKLDVLIEQLNRNMESRIKELSSEIKALGR